MQGQRRTIGSLPEILEFSHGSASGNPVVNPPICWNNIPDPVGNRMPNYILAPNADIAYVNPINQQQQNLSGWSLDEPNFSGSQNEVIHDVHEREDGFPFSSTALGGTGQRSEGWQCEPPNVLSLGSVNTSPLFLCSSNSDVIPQDLNSNADFGCNDHQASEFPNLSKSSGSVSEHIQLAGSSNTFLPPSGSGYLLQENDSRPNCSSDGPRASCKRKAHEGSAGQSSSDGSPNYLHRPESRLWHGSSSRSNEGTILSISSPLEQSKPRLCARASDTVSASTMTRSAESSHRNFRVRINSANQQEPTPVTLPSAGNAERHSSVSTPQQSSRLIPVDGFLDLRSASSSNSAIPQSQTTVNDDPSMLQNVQPFEWSESSSSRAVTSASVFVSNDRNEVLSEEVSSRSRARNIQEHPMFVPETNLRSRVQMNGNLSGARTDILGNVGSTATASSSSGVHRLPAPHWVPHPHPPSRNSRRLPEYVRRSLLSSISSDSGGQNNSLPHSAASSSDERALPSGGGNHRHHRLNSRLMSWMERQGDGALGIPHPLRTLASAGEERSRLVVSERIRNVLELMRRGENIRFEDVMLLDHPSVLFWGADLHDRHRDMRLDVDNMSYEELLALEERIGNVSTGLSKEIILNQLKRRTFSPSAATQRETEPCCICQEDYNDGEDIGTLDCGHGFHAECIKQWLTHKNLCPICKTTGLAK